ncbi:YlxR family protein [Georgenia satyanarayanai]|uniref:YlxR family protein n=1 Tax=Georgenia satyanarayanai TaxID=860221 RepID=UPI000DA1CACC|nr:YlxR family protein [Georgenia satyanarayanai]
MTTPPPPSPPGEGQVRTCVGCRARAPRSALVRVVLAPHSPRAVVDERTDAPGRGAWLHADRACLDLADRRRAFPRALRSAGPVDTAAVTEWFRTNNAGSDLGRHESSTKKAGWKPMGTR